MTAIAEDDDVDCPECEGPTIEADAVDGVYRVCQVCGWAWRVW
jgi:rubredoxin